MSADWKFGDVLLWRDGRGQEWPEMFIGYGENTDHVHVVDLEPDTPLTNDSRVDVVDATNCRLADAH